MVRVRMCVRVRGRSLCQHIERILGVVGVRCPPIRNGPRERVECVCVNMHGYPGLILFVRDSSLEPWRVWVHSK